jgi:uncharacterized protein (DUF2252 family)
MLEQMMIGYQRALKGPRAQNIIATDKPDPAAAPRARAAKMPKDNGRRVVESAKHLSPALGDRMIAARLLGRSMVLREKLEIDQLSRPEAS